MHCLEGRMHESLYSVIPQKNGSNPLHHDDQTYPEWRCSHTGSFLPIFCSQEEDSKGYGNCAH